MVAIDLRAGILTHNHSAIKSELEIAKANEMLNALDSIPNVDLENVVIECVKTKFFTLKDLAKSIAQELERVAEAEAQSYYIAKFKGTHLQEHSLIALFLYKQLEAKMPKCYRLLIK